MTPTMPRRDDRSFGATSLLRLQHAAAHAVELDTIDREHSHRDVSGGWLRPAVFGAMDGLVTNISLIAGVGGGGAASRSILLTGVAGLAAGAFSMATGEYTSVRSQNEAVAAEVELEALQLRFHPEAEIAELAESYVARGVDPDLARTVAEQLSADPEQALRTHTQQELGINPEDLPSPWLAAASSFVCFAVGALIPLLPYLVGYGGLVGAMVLTGLALLLAGGSVARINRRSLVGGAGRQLLLGALATAVTYGIGRLVGATIH